MADPGKDKKSTKIKIEHGKINIRTSTKTTTKYGILPFPSLLQKRPNTKEMEIKHTHKKTQTYRLRRSMADPGKDKKRTKIKIEHG